MYYKVDIYDQFGSDLQSIWRRFEKVCDHYVFQCYDWLAHWQRTIGENCLRIKPCVSVVTSNGSPIALFPFGIRRFLGARLLEFLGGDQSDYNAPLVHPDYSDSILCRDIWESVLKHLPRHDIQLFRKLPAHLNSRDNPLLNVWASTPEYEAYAATLPQSMELFQKRISSKVRNDSRRQLRRLAEHGTVKFLIANTDEEYDRLVTAMIKQKRRRFQETGARDMLSDAATQTFYSNLRGAIGIKGSVHCSALMLNNNVLATHWGIVYGNRFYFLLPTFASGEWEKFSAGRLLQERIMEWSIDNGLETFDFTIGSEQYKKIWCDQKMYIHNKQNLIAPAGLPCMLYMTITIWIKTNPKIRKYIMSAIRRLRKLR